jgi:molybdenum cofactor synthesis domain-containing protein
LGLKLNKDFMTSIVTAAFIIIGNEILLGRTQDKNLNYVALKLSSIGIQLCEARIIADHEPTIIETINTLRKQYHYIFTSGGIGPTHDDITTQAVAKAFGVAVLRDLEAEKRLRAHYKAEDINAARLKMADIPDGAQLIDNPVSAAPGFYIDNVFVMAGVPRIMQAMCDFIIPLLKGGDKISSKTLSVFITEGYIAEQLTKIQQQHPDVEIGSYPFIRDGRLGTSLVVRGYHIDALHKAYDALKNWMETIHVEMTHE